MCCSLLTDVKNKVIFFENIIQKAFSLVLFSWGFFCHHSHQNIIQMPFRINQCKSMWFYMKIMFLQLKCYKNKNTLQIEAEKWCILIDIQQIVAKSYNPFPNSNFRILNILIVKNVNKYFEWLVEWNTFNYQQLSKNCSN